MNNHIPDKLIKNKMIKTLAITLLLLSNALYSKAQLVSFQNMYFQNRYTYNPAMAGLTKGLNLNLGYRKQWNSFPGTPETTLLTVALKATDKVGLGINIVNDKSGLLKQTRAVATYAYHLQLDNEGQQLSFGLSLGVNDSRVDYNLLNADPTDVEIGRYNQLKAYLDGDFGAAYTSNRLYIGIALPNMKSTLSQNSDTRMDANKLLFVGMVSYKIPVGDNDNFRLEPLAGLRVIKGYKDVVDAGLNFTMNQYGLYFQGIYHNNENIDFGAGLDQGSYALNFSYNVETGQLKTYTNGTFELGLKLRLFGK